MSQPVIAAVEGTAVAAEPMSARPAHLVGVTWEEFEELHFAKHCSYSANQQMEEDFRNLRQGNRSVQEYDCEFARIVSRLPSVVHNEWGKARRFERGLRPNIYLKV